MPLVDQVEALWRSLFGAGTQPPLIDAVEQMLGRVGIAGCGRGAVTTAERAAAAVAAGLECGVS